MGAEAKMEGESERNTESMLVCAYIRDRDRDGNSRSCSGSAAGTWKHDESAKGQKEDGGRMREKRREYNDAVCPRYEPVFCTVV